ncbi:MAG: thioredoxin [Halobacteriales archaeon]
MTLETLTPAPDWSAAAHRSAVEVLASLGPDEQVKVWCDDGCVDCRALLPEFAAALDAADLPSERINQFEVERLPEGRKRGPQVDAYDINRIPTVVVEREGTELARFEEGEPPPIASALASQLDDG